MKKLIILMALTAACYAEDNKPKLNYNTSASGSSKANALAEAIARIPPGAKIENVSYNGYSIRTCTSETGSYKCIIRYSK